MAPPPEGWGRGDARVSVNIMAAAGIEASEEELAAKLQLTGVQREIVTVTELLPPAAASLRELSLLHVNEA